MSVRIYIDMPNTTGYNLEKLFAIACMKDGTRVVSGGDIKVWAKEQTVKEETGKWIIKDGKEQGYDIAGIKTWYMQIMCDKCGFINTAIEGHTGQYRFCPNCGARMEVENK